MQAELTIPSDAMTDQQILGKIATLQKIVDDANDRTRRLVRGTNTKILKITYKQI